jgi:hypothetical protein
MLRADPRQRSGLVNIVRSLIDRNAEACANGWLSEVQGLQVSLDTARKKLASLDHSACKHNRTGPVTIGMPTIGGR